MINECPELPEKPLPTHTTRPWIVQATRPSENPRRFFIMRQSDDALVAAALTQQDATLIVDVLNAVDELKRALSIAGHVLTCTAKDLKLDVAVTQDAQRLVESALAKVETAICPWAWE